jgi:superoxide reductase
MTQHLQVYKCETCGNIVEVNHASGGTLVCCGSEMKLQEEKTADKATEKHVPVVEKVDGGYKVTVGSTLHPMTEEHHIEWIELVTDKQVLTQFLNAGDAPVAVFKTDENVLYAREYCNLHGLWKG